MSAAGIDKIAWIYVENGRILSARSKGKDTYYIPGGKRDPGETDTDTLVREVEEEVSVRIKPETVSHFGTFEAQAHGKEEGVLVRMACYQADFEGDLSPASEIEELVWLAYGDREHVSPVSRLIFDRLHELKLLL
ncbi:NUDIX domain-containing protein [Paenibacillus chitinolyticus]|uniref:NUDIX domain-containing protein n=1 Tax=Paenibacillus chitinolyticus TaxID=79263 RepID=A0A410WZT8_9BACL|nr:NUDIX domain-containing protein [Paenibacillus chitinolyticus]MCY9590294.1 NUDIX domain-containing protein [Paenibacillus chitinolyticus]MCY9596990.1 NUDIX domain-containing protein [Paenibacillus chitinolyticus]QAV19711.1 NUDIX domain-containing protein [Paenibacillus chitinolyticus]